MNHDVSDNPPQPSPEKRSFRRSRAWREIVSWFWVVCAFVLIEGSVAQARVIPSGSMENTVLIGDHLIVSSVGYQAGIPFTDHHLELWRTPKRQQIIVFRGPLPDQNYPDLIKRCIGVPGDRIKIVAGTVYVNGAPLNEPYALHSPGAEGLPWENFPARSSEMFFSDVPEWQAELKKYVVNGELVVPPGKYFAMGDNRDDSNDSRFWGFIPRENIIGEPAFVYMSIESPGEVWEPGHMTDRAETYLGAIVHPTRIRWGRLFRPLPERPVRSGSGG